MQGLYVRLTVCSLVSGRNATSSIFAAVTKKQLRKASSGSINPLVRQSVSPLVHQHGTSRLALNGSLWIYVLMVFTEICWENWSLVEVRPKQQRTLRNDTGRSKIDNISLQNHSWVETRHGEPYTNTTEHKVTLRDVTCMPVSTARIPTQGHNVSRWLTPLGYMQYSLRCRT